ncbi:3-dehydroquinate synthase [Microbacter margulisiae]|uniref:3-dehydroquinate synthase n=1 Tax=Microbacter margulisiae TaxID=1350067 RepID=A0A7W5DSQ9_9PORP|nr:3-dehydroquinate synthase [Microbacter margulisiae]MBB3188377.1 3-dehydroquinate synthase [Microbacter margulisiae]
MSKSVTITYDFEQELKNQIAVLAPDFIFLLVDSNTHKLCLSKMESEYPVIEIPAGDDHKTIDNLASVWQFLSTHKATRHSLLINIGGGMVTDLGGFAASTFKRGIRYINVPTTLLGAVDAAVGGKTGINFNGLKNEVGVIHSSEAVILYPQFFRTLNHENLMSGWAEMIKHALLSSTKAWEEILSFQWTNVDYDALGKLVEQSIAVKEAIVEQDPTEKSIRKALNLGHTFGHAFESFSYSTARPLLHGYAVAFGLICELYLSHIKVGLPEIILHQAVQHIKQHYGAFSFEKTDYPVLLELMTHDKKNDASGINFTLLNEPGEIRINQHATREEIYDAFDFFLHIF